MPRQLPATKETYTIQVGSKTTTLRFSSVGFQDADARIGNRNAVDISLVRESGSLSEVVVVGYGVQQKKAFTGSAAKIDAKEFAQLVTPSVDKQLAGRAAGVQVVNAGGDVGTPARIRIRGINSVTGNQSPLIVVDGVPFITGNLSCSNEFKRIG